MSSDVCIPQEPRKIAGGSGKGIYWIEECVEAGAMAEYLTRHPEGQEYAEGWYEEGKGLHLSINAYLLIGEDKSLLFDTLSPASREHIVDTVEELLDGDDLDYVVVSHDEAPHAGNTFALVDRFPEATFIGANAGSPVDELHHYEAARRVDFGETIDLGGYEAEFVEPVFSDSPATLWLLERDTRFMCTVDSFGFPHYPSDCVKFEDEMETDMNAFQMMQYNGRSIQWLEFADPEKVRDQLQYHIDHYEPEILAPAHGQLLRGDLQKYAEFGYEAAKHLSENRALLPLFLTVKQLEEMDAEDAEDTSTDPAAGD
ncbi:MAG: MBL fold metallo-hydrolase [Haloglomus sp.]